MARDPDLTPEAWEARPRFVFHPLVLLPLLPLVGLVVMVGRVVADPGVESWVGVVHLVALTMVASVASPWHLPRRPIHDPVGRTITFRARASLGLMPLGLVLWGAVLVVHFELMRLRVIDRELRIWGVDLPWWVTLPAGFVMIGLGLYVARPTERHELMVGVDGLHFDHGRRSFLAPWDQVLRLVPTLRDRVHRTIEVHGPGLVAHDADGHRTRPTVDADLLDSDAVRLWLTLEYYLRHPTDREELGTAASRQRRAEWRRVLPREYVSDSR
ncbi:hypothetical protein [Intrasporangium sp.]|uniref:hypothetical protein n=1 Tax=Intrasporangium sp. TaxID=1925024 RepID=UPI002939C4E0|nr:hypothetical protein [Intrasporangium sp.]MDV3222279.1 hypothetical protein [Intrasporangium sp.]